VQIAFILDIIVALLLVLTITYAVRLNQRLSQLRSDKNELLELAKTFADATARAETSINQLKVSSKALQDDLNKAEALRDDLAYLVDRGGRTADQMVASVRTPSRPSDRATGHSTGHSGQDRSFAEDDDLLIEEAIRAATPGVGGRVDANSGARSQGRFAARSGGERFSDEDMKPRSLARETGRDVERTTRRISGHPEPAVAPRGTAPRNLGGGLGGLKAEDRLLDNPIKSAEPNSFGDTDAARELLKALSSMK